MGVRQLCLRRIGVRGQKSLKTAGVLYHFVMSGQLRCAKFVNIYSAKSNRIFILGAALQAEIEEYLKSLFRYCFV